MIGTVVLGREMTLSEVYRSTFGCVLGPLGLGDRRSGWCRPTA